MNFLQSYVKYFKKNNCRRWFLISLFFIPLILFTCIGFHIEYSPDSFFGVTYKGVVNNVYFETFYIYMHYWEWLLQYLYKVFPTVSWYGYLLLFYTIIAVYLLWIVWKKIILNTLDTHSSILFTLLLGAIWSMMLFYIGFTRIPFYIAGLVFINILINKEVRNKTFIFLLGLIATGACWMRYESTLAALIVIIPNLLFVFINQRDRFLSILLRLTLIFSVGFVGIWIHHQIYSSPKDQLAREFYNLHFNFFDAHQRVSPNNPKDSIRIEAMKMDFNADKTMLNINEYRRLTIGQPLKLNNQQLIKTKLERSLKELNYLYYDNSHLVLLNLFMIFITMIICYKDKRNLSILLLNHIWALFVILAIVYFLKYANRVIQPIFILATISNLICLFYARKSLFYLSNRITSIVFLFLLLLSYRPFYAFYKNESNIERNIIQQNDHALKAISDIYKKGNQDIIFSNDGYELFKSGLLSELTKSDLVVYSMDTHINYLRGGDAALEKYCSCSTVFDFYQFLSLQDKNLVFIATERRIRMLKDYFSILYGYEIDFQNIDKNYSHVFINHHSKLHLYNIIGFYPISNKPGI